MYLKKTYSTVQMAWWTRFESIFFVGIITAWVSAYHFFDLTWLKIPWTPLALIGTAVAFVIGFQNNASYGRIWEARQIWGAIVNTSRTFGMFVQAVINNEYTDQPMSKEELQGAIKSLTYRHIAWMTALRHAMRQSKPWETAVQHKTNQEWASPPEWDTTLEEDLKPYISEEEYKEILTKDNKPMALLYMQSAHLQQLKEKGAIWEFSFLELEGMLKDLFTHQGKSERIKNFPYPRHFATLNHFFMWIFVLLLPLAMVPQFLEIGHELATGYPWISKLFIWFSIPFYTIVAWVFHTMERIGRTGENPFEGTANDVPISTIARGIEIDLRQNLGEAKDEIPKQFEAKFDTQF
ncbi:MAG: bestrophin family ion channel [Reichenbachiella sp.]|uniref:bestrophin family protein n=1 Tax=Reichenbachiella sp. TaxID=2184521 RepID=UPI003265C536